VAVPHWVQEFGGTESSKKITGKKRFGYRPDNAANPLLPSHQGQEDFQIQLRDVPGRQVFSMSPGFNRKPTGRLPEIDVLFHVFWIPPRSAPDALFVVCASLK